MKKYLLGLALAATVSTSAMAADLPGRTIAVVPPPVFTWTGFYVGLNAGYAKTWNNTTIVDLFGYTNSTSANGFTGGAQLGYNMQSGSLVYGLETDINFLSNKARQTGCLIGCFTPPFLPDYSFESRARYIGTIRGRMGLAFDRTLVYITAGAAYGGFRNSINLLDHNGPDSLRVFKDGGTRWGVAIGGGVEYAWTNNLSVRLEGLYTAFEPKTTSCNIEGYACSILINTNQETPVTLASPRAKFENSALLIRAGVNYRFW